MKKSMLYILVLPILIASSGVTRAATLTIQLQDYRHIGATAYIAIYVVKKGASWGDNPARLLQSQLQEGDSMTLDTDLPPGRYALRAFVDINGNGELDTGVQGKPVEPFAFSRAAGAATSLRFNAAAIELGNKAELQLRFLHPKSGVNPAFTPVEPVLRE